EENIQKNLDNAKKNLGDVMNMDVRTGYTFSSQFYSDRLNDDIVIDVEDAVTYALKRDKTTASDYYKYNEASELVDFLYNRFEQRFGRVMHYIRSYFKADDLTTINWTQFKADYDKFYSHIDDPWDFWIFLWFFFWIIPLYVMWFRPTPISTKYLEDSKYALYDMLKEKYEAQIAYQESFRQKKIAIENAYNSLDNIRFSYEASLTDVERASRDYQTALVKNRSGTLTYEQLEDIRQRVTDSQNTAFENLIDYNEELSSFDHTTCGYLWYRLTGEEFASVDTMGGFSYGEEESGPTYTIEMDVVDKTKKFAVQMNSSTLEPTHYEIWTASGHQVGVRTAISEELMHLSLVFAEEKMMYIKLFKDGAQIAQATFDGTLAFGYLNFEQVSPGPEPKEDDGKAGTFERKETGITSSLKLNFDESHAANITYFAIMSNDGQTLGGEGTKTHINEEFMHLSSALSDYEAYYIVTYNANGAELMSEFTLQEINGEGFIMEK
ncbi:MAG: hypothetical protein IJC39_04660, partial [Firmicutes bacterium]|nr:hypothetical protein [Bacillota bacterium]